MRRATFLCIFALAILTPSLAEAGSCYFANGTIYCDEGCRVTDRWWDAGGRPWMNYSCLHPASPQAAVGLALVFALIVLAVIAAVNSSKPIEDETAAINDEIAKTKDLADKLEAAAREADAHLAAFRVDGGRLEGDR